MFGDRRHHVMEETFEHPVPNVPNTATTLGCPVILSSGDGGVQAAIISSASSARVHTTQSQHQRRTLWQSDNMGAYDFHSILSACGQPSTAYPSRRDTDIDCSI